MTVLFLYPPVFSWLIPVLGLDYLLLLSLRKGVFLEWFWALGSFYGYIMDFSRTNGIFVRIKYLWDFVLMWNLLNNRTRVQTSASTFRSLYSLTTIISCYIRVFAHNEYELFPTWKISMHYAMCALAHISMNIFLHNTWNMYGQKTWRKTTYP